MREKAETFEQTDEQRKFDRRTLDFQLTAAHNYAKLAPFLAAELLNKTTLNDSKSCEFCPECLISFIPPTANLDVLTVPKFHAKRRFRKILKRQEHSRLSKCEDHLLTHWRKIRDRSDKFGTVQLRCRNCQKRMTLAPFCGLKKLPNPAPAVTPMVKRKANSGENAGFSPLPVAETLLSTLERSAKQNRKRRNKAESTPNQTGLTQLKRNLYAASITPPTTCEQSSFSKYKTPTNRISSLQSFLSSI